MYFSLCWGVLKSSKGSSKLHQVSRVLSICEVFLPLLHLTEADAINVLMSVVRSSTVFCGISASSVMEAGRLRRQKPEARGESLLLAVLDMSRLLLVDLTNWHREPKSPISAQKRCFIKTAVTSEMTHQL